MYTAAALLDIHARAHRSLAGLMAHCADLTPDELHRELPGFGYPTVQLQFHHVIGAERYWIGVLAGKMLVDEDDDEYSTIESLQQMREEVAGATERVLQAVPESALNQKRTVTTWGGYQRVLMPAHVVLRISMHIFDHKGQIGAMCRVLGKPLRPGLDFSLDVV